MLARLYFCCSVCWIFLPMQYCSEQNCLQEFVVLPLTWEKKKFWTKNAKESVHYGLAQDPEVKFWNFQNINKNKKSKYFNDLLFCWKKSQLLRFTCFFLVITACVSMACMNKDSFTVKFCFNFSFFVCYCDDSKNIIYIKK